MSKSLLFGIPIAKAWLYASVPVAGVCMLLMQSELFFLFIATESAAIAVVWAIICGAFIYKRLTLKGFWQVLERALNTLAMLPTGRHLP